tara:strand:+ start:916 stop:1059 length:144 start_codon:yes stop_codon:yes gene_type:complete
MAASAGVAELVDAPDYQSARYRAFRNPVERKFHAGSSPATRTNPPKD